MNLVIKKKRGRKPKPLNEKQQFKWISLSLYPEEYDLIKEYLNVLMKKRLLNPYKKNNYDRNIFILSMIVEDIINTEPTLLLKYKVRSSIFDMIKRRKEFKSLDKIEEVWYIIYIKILGGIIHEFTRFN